MRIPPLPPRQDLQGQTIRALAFAVLVTASSLAGAHYPWLHVEPAAPGGALDVEIGWGHQFPGNDRLTADRVASISLVSGAGDAPLVLSAQDGRYRVTAAQRANAALLVGLQQPSYYSRTPQGGRRGSRLDHPDARSCSQSHNSFKALIGDGPGVSLALGHRFELVPGTGLSRLGAGGGLPLQVLWQGRPWQGELTAIYAGYAKRQGEADYPVVLRTDADGRAVVPLDRKGAWLVRAAQSETYPNPATCDNRNYHATLTFTVP